MAKTIGYGSIITVATSTSGTLELAQLRGISGPGVSGNDVDTTTLDSSSNYRTFVGGLLDPGEVTFQLIYDSTSITHARLAYYMGQKLQKTYTVYHGSSGGDSDAFLAHVKGMSREIPLDDVISCDVTMKVSGKPGYTT